MPGKSLFRDCRKRVCCREPDNLEVVITASKLRQNVYKILDEAIATGVPVEVLRKGKIVRIIADRPVSKLSRLRKRTGFRGDADEIAGMDWSADWSEIK